MRTCTPVVTIMKHTSSQEQHQSKYCYNSVHTLYRRCRPPTPHRAAGHSSVAADSVRWERDPSCQQMRGNTATAAPCHLRTQPACTVCFLLCSGCGSIRLQGKMMAMQTHTRKQKGGPGTAGRRNTSHSTDSASTQDTPMPHTVLTQQQHNVHAASMGG